MSEEHTYTQRGFAQWAPIECKYGSEVKVRQSSAAAEDCVWLYVRGFDAPQVPVQEGATIVGKYIAAAHLNEELVDKLIAQLQAWKETL